LCQIGHNAYCNQYLPALNWYLLWIGMESCSASVTMSTRNKHPKSPTMNILIWSVVTCPSRYSVTSSLWMSGLCKEHDAVFQNLYEILLIRNFLLWFHCISIVGDFGCLFRIDIVADAEQLSIPIQSKYQFSGRRYWLQ